MNHNLIHRLLITIFFCGLTISSYAQSASDSLALIFSPSEIKKLTKGDEQISNGIDLYPEINLLLSTYKNSNSKNPGISQDEYKMQTTLRACRPYYVGMFAKTDVYLNRLKKLKTEKKDLNEIDALLDRYKVQVKASKKDFQKSRNSRHLKDAVKYSADAINKHREMQAAMYSDIIDIINRKPEEIVEEKTIAPPPPVEIIETTPEEPVEVTTIVPKKTEETVTVTEEAPIPVVVEKIPEKTVQQPETYFSIQIIADKTTVSESRLKIVYKGSRKIIMNEGDGWYRYSIGKFKSFEEANSVMKSEGIKGFVVAYSDGKRITTSQAKTILNSK
ncbi:SPOR domain-containing protein [Carboxylicivirga caseinilyticus]|uniref:SPOR domain-containing protein n=1 Tax=Carboxylicivirga caseinilyticus TaxID=3417572 RepID=UPI003D33D1E7|nr:SPOR domain-containing protein [Marinilabiliaceae bacterium A049]